MTWNATAVKSHQDREARKDAVVAWLEQNPRASKTDLHAAMGWNSRDTTATYLQELHAVGRVVWAWADRGRTFLKVWSAA